MERIGYARAPLAADTGRGPSASIWGSCPIEDIQRDAGVGTFFFDDFTETMPAGTQTTHLNLGKYNVFCSTAGVIAQTVTPLGGVALTGGHISMLCDTAGDAASIAQHSGPFVLNGNKLWFEARIAQTGIATNNAQLFVGFGETPVFTALSATVPLGDANTANSTGAMIGFNVLEDGLGVLNSCYQDRSATWTYAQSSLSLGMAANTYIKVGMMYDPNNSAEAITFYVNGVKQTGVITSTVLAALTSLDVNALGLVFAMFADSAGTTNYAYLDWWQAAQLTA